MDPMMKEHLQAESASSERTREARPDDDNKQPSSDQSDDHIVNGREGIRGAEFWRKWRSLPAA